MSDKLMQTLAQLQTENRKFKQELKIRDQKLLERDETMKIANEEYQKSLAKLKDDLAFKDKVLKSLRPKPKIRKVKKMKIDPIVKDILNELKFNPSECLWEKHGATCMKHRYIEIAGQNKGVSIDSLDEVEKNSAEGVVAIKCTASLGKAKVITYGEATPKNNKNGYPYAMAEKRAVDRAILKLIGITWFCLFR